jgi:8-oxo-dGTP pyrophosphatase MutT (NUDIX family)
MAKTSGSRQYAALPIRKARGGVREVLLVTSRETRRWIIPKGWPMAGLSGAEVAQVEAFEEAGIRGKATRKPVGHYDYWKRLDDAFRLVRVEVFRMKVTRLFKSWPEAGSRQRAWFPLEKAVELVDEPGLRAILSEMFPRGKAARVESETVPDNSPRESGEGR